MLQHVLPPSMPPRARLHCVRRSLHAVRSHASKPGISAQQAEEHVASIRSDYGVGEGGQQLPGLAQKSLESACRLLSEHCTTRTRTSCPR